jgi:glycosyltransferase involved in cell wall biosynthesis
MSLHSRRDWLHPERAAGLIGLEMPIELSVVIPTHNRAALLEGALGALAPQEGRGSLDWEIVVVDNNSRDHTADVVDSMSKLTAIPVVYVFEPRLGLSHARNRGINEARGSIIAFIDDDVLPAPDWIIQIVSAMDRWRAHGVGGRILPHWEAPPPDWLTQRQDLLDRLAIMDHADSCVLSYPVRGRPQVWGGNMAFRREIFEEIGGFDDARGRVGTKLFRGEEVELVNRALGHGLRIVYDPALVVQHRIGHRRLRRAYFLKMEFDAAQGEIGADRIAKGRAILGVPLWLFRLLFVAFWKWIALFLCRRPGAFDQLLDLFRWMGRLVGYWNLRRALDVNGSPSQGPSSRPTPRG